MRRGTHQYPFRGKMVTLSDISRYYNNKGLFFGSIFGVLLIVALVLFSVMKKRKNTLNQH